MPGFPALEGSNLRRRLLAGMRLAEWLRDRARNSRARRGDASSPGSAPEKQAAHHADADGEAQKAEGGFDILSEARPTAGKVAHYRPVVISCRL